jgi:Domain of unknown function (DUF6702)
LTTVAQYFIAFLCSCIILKSVKESKKEEKHPTYLAVAQIDFDSRDKFATLLCKTFNDDLALALQKEFSEKESIMAPADVKKLSAEMEKYIKGHLQIKINGNNVDFSFTNYKEDAPNNSVAMYFKINNVDRINNLEINDTVFYELYDSQIQILYVTVDGNRKSGKIRNPVSKASFDF